MYFEDRSDAGGRLAARLLKYRKEEPLVLGLPRGGVVVAYEVAHALEAPLDVLVVRKLGMPGYPELAVGAIAPGGVRVLDEPAIYHAHLPYEAIEQVTAHEERELQRRLRTYRQGQPPLAVAGRTVLLVDDGVATGWTARAAIQSLLHLHPRKLVLAVPVGAPDTLRDLREEVDDLVCLSAPEEFRAVGQYYRRFDQTTDEEVLELLEKGRTILPALVREADGALA